jgi:hypothetical protein
MNQTSELQQRTGLALAVAFSACFLAAGTRAHAAMQVLPMQLGDNGYNTQTISGDGKVVLGYTDEFSAYWSQATGLVPRPLPNNGTSWKAPSFLSYDGNVVVGSGRMENKLQESAWTWRRHQGFRVVAPPDDSHPISDSRCSLDRPRGYLLFKFRGLISASHNWHSLA